MFLGQSSFVRTVLCVLPLSVLLACTTETTSEPETTAVSEDALKSVGQRGDEGRELECSKARPDASVSPIDWDAEDLAVLAAHGCEPPFLYNTGASAGVLGAIMSVCVDRARTRSFVAERTNAPNAWLPEGYCDPALVQLPAGRRYVAWSWFIGPNCSGCEKDR